MRFAQIITEGGNVFKGDTVDVNQADIPPTIHFLSGLVGKDLTDEWLGSTGQKPVSGDIDLAMDAKTYNKDDLVAKLSAWVTAHGGDPRKYVRKTGVSVHFLTPIGGNKNNGFCQTDFMFLPDPALAKQTMRSDPNSRFKDSHKHILLSSIAKFHGFKWSPTIGLISRVTEKLISKDPNEIAQILLGPGSSLNDIRSVESILKRINNSPDRDAEISDARDTLGRQGISI
jgi:hypothetical protein